jgi:SAM-dependent methyltransferase
MTYDPTYVSRYYDDYSEREWDLLQASPASRVSFHLHRRYLQRYVEAGNHVVEVGAGPGRFTIELAKIGARITVGDISPIQLELNRQKVVEAVHEASVVPREILDVVDLSRFASNVFDAVVCFGGVLSYLFERVNDGLAELLRVTRPGGFVLMTVMSLLGSTRRFLPGILDLAKVHGLSAIQQVNDTGDLTGELSDGHRCHMFRWAEFEQLIRRHQCDLVAASASSFLASGNEDALRAIEESPETWHAFLGWETGFCKEPGVLDSGTHINAVVRKASLSVDTE